MAFNHLTEEEQDEICNYGLGMSAFHDSRYFDKETVWNNGYHPDTCPENIKSLLIKEYGEFWEIEFWGENYREIFK